ncbi:hypothetical protein [Klenkia marina]|uniref:hypothetical protein n=1 Tax=Klenkia marina TaxID=1960309 RepID=UPI000B827B0D|nr:hypothetical protein [Klenkia marina]
MMQADGNLVVYGGRGEALWSTRTYASSGGSVRLSDDGAVVVSSGSGAVLWSSGSDDRSVLRAGQRLFGGQSLVSANGAYRLVVQADGNLVVQSAGGAVLWTQGGAPGGSLIMQTDGNLVHYRPDGSASWASRTWSPNLATARLLDDGVLVVVDADARALWARSP